MQSFQALRIYNEQGSSQARLEQLRLSDLGTDAVLIRVQYSSINYKDVLAVTGAGKILRRFPLIAGIDLAGEVVESADTRYPPGLPVLVTGCGLSETHDGGYAEYARVPAEWVIPIPQQFDAFSAMQLGTAGFSAALAIQRLEHHGLTPAQGPVLVTGATGGVGSIAILLLCARGYTVTALTRKQNSKAYLQHLGAHHVLCSEQLSRTAQPLASAQWAGAIDTVGGDWLSWIIRSTQMQGAVASVGMVGGSELHTSVMPFILRGVSVLGVNSAAAPRAVREQVWQRIADLNSAQLNLITTQVVTLPEVLPLCARYLQGQVIGRTVVKIP